ncbi:MAG: hypothetical protein M3Z05_20850 [Gemmatimonadota bacterium]|nr:hypothetical protein [Gemmatimonadota bacterium]
MPRTRLHRAGLILTAIFQFLLPTFASVADARAEAASERGAFAHVESHSTSHCVPAHAADCAFCRVISSGATVARATTVQAVAERTISAALPLYHGLAIGPLARGAPSQRAPPVL